MNCIRNGLKVLSSSLKKRLDASTRAMIEVGYLNSELQRTETGIHQILNFVEQDSELGPRFVTFIKALRDEKVEDAKEEAAD